METVAPDSAHPARVWLVSGTSQSAPTVLWAVVQAHEENPASHRHEAGLGGTPRASDGAVRTPAYATSGRLGAGAAGGPEQGNDRVGL